VIIASDAGDAWAPAKPRPHDTLIRALARAHFVDRLLRLTLLAPDIVEGILEGRPTRTDAAMQLQDLARAMPSA
jgi:hypothetical protein